LSSRWVKSPEEGPNAKAMIKRKIKLWKAALERGDSGILCDALVAQRNVPDLLKERLDLKGP